MKRDIRGVLSFVLRTTGVGYAKIKNEQIRSEAFQDYQKRKDQEAQGKSRTYSWKENP